VTQQVDSDHFCDRTCPSCFLGEASLSVSCENPADVATFATASKGWFGFFKKPMFFNFYRCCQCGLLYNRRFFSSSALEKLYSELPDNTAGQELSHLQKTQAGYYKFLKQHTRIEGTYLEVGPDIGLFTKLIAASPDIKRLLLFEPNQAVHSDLQKAAKDKPYQVFSDLFNFAEVPNNSIQLAVAIHVLDHLLEPQEFIKEIFNKLAPGGTLLVVTHNERSLLARILKQRWPAHCLQHPQLFNRLSTKTFLENCGFENVKTKRTINYFTIGYLLKHLAWALNLGTFKFFDSLNLVLPLPLGNIMTVAMRPKERLCEHRPRKN